MLETKNFLWDFIIIDFAACHRLLTVFTWINYRSDWYFVFTFSPSSTFRLCLRWTASKLSFWVILVFCDKLGTLFLKHVKAVQYDSRVLHILTGTEDITHRYCISSRVLRIWLMSTAYPPGYWGYDLQVLHILTGAEDMSHGYWGYNSWVLHILTCTGTEDMTHRYWGYDSRVLMIWLTGNAYPHGYCI